jgi:hypothetical protein
MYGDYPITQKRDRSEDPPITVYLVNNHKGQVDKLSCMFCKRTICDFKGRIDKIIDIPLDVEDFGIAINIRCKLCKANYRMVVNATVVNVVI